MKYVPSLPPLITVPEDRLEAKALNLVGTVKPVQERTLTPLIVQRNKHPETLPYQIPRDERRLAEPLQEERRAYCRRINHQTFREEIRSVVERRRHKQRGTDLTEHVDEEV